MSRAGATERRSDEGAERPTDEPRKEQARQWDIRFELTRGECSRALNRYWFRTYRYATISKSLVLVAAAVFTWLSTRTMWIAVVWTAFVISCLQYLVAYVRYRRRSLAWLRDAEDTAVSYTFSNDGIAISSEQGASLVKWRALDELWRYPDIWLLIRRKVQYFVLPTRSLPEDLQAAIERWMRLGAGGRPTCSHCGYDLRGQKTPRCPECGKAFEEDVLKIRQ